MTRARWIGVAVALLAFEAIAVRVGWIADPIPRIAGTAVWTTSRAAGATAFGALALDVIFGLFLSTGVLDRRLPRGASVDVHRWLSSVALTLVVVHSLALLADPAVQFDAISVLVPGESPYRNGAVALGVVAMYGALVLHLSFGWRKKIGVRTWRALHGIAFLVFLAAVAHGLLAGSDSGHTGMRACYAGTLAAVLILSAIRIASIRSAPRAVHVAQPGETDA